MAYPKDLLYTKEHEWVKVEGNKVKIGITEYAQEELGDIVFVELPAVDDPIEEGEGFAVVESVKAVSDIYAPVSGTISAVNERLEDSPELVNESPYEDGWIAQVELSDRTQLDDLMTAEEYESFVKEA